MFSEQAFNMFLKSKSLCERMSSYIIKNSLTTKLTLTIQYNLIDYSPGEKCIDMIMKYVQINVEVLFFPLHIYIQLAENTMKAWYILLFIW